MLKIQGISRKCTNSREPSFCPTHFSSCRRHSVTLCDLFTFLLLSTHTFIILCPTCKELLHPATHRVSPFLNFPLWVSGAALSAVIKTSWFFGWVKPCFPSFVLPLLKVSCQLFVISLLPCSIRLQHLHPSDTKVLEQELRQALVPAVAQLPERDRRE